MSKTEERLKAYKLQMSIYTQQHQMLLASDVLDMIEQLQDDLQDDTDKLADQLEELKAYREIGTIEELRGAVLKIQEAYNKAIGDFAEACKQNIMCQTFGLHPRNVDEIAKQLKAGDVD